MAITRHDHVGGSLRCALEDPVIGRIPLDHMDVLARPNDGPDPIGVRSTAEDPSIPRQNPDLPGSIGGPNRR